MKINVEESISPCTEQAWGDIKTSFENRIKALLNAEMDQIWAKAFLAASLLVKPIGERKWPPASLAPILNESLAANTHNAAQVADGERCQAIEALLVVDINLAG